MKRSVSIVLWLMLVTALCGCGNKSQNVQDVIPEKTEQQTAEVSEKVSGDEAVEVVEANDTESEAVDQIFTPGENNDPEASEKLNLLFDMDEYAFAIASPYKETDGTREIGTYCTIWRMLSKPDLTTYTHEYIMGEEVFVNNGKDDSRAITEDSPLIDIFDKYGTSDFPSFTARGSKLYMHTGSESLESWDIPQTPYEILKGITPDKFSNMATDGDKITGQTMLSTFHPMLLIPNDGYCIKGLDAGSGNPDILMDVTVTIDDERMRMDAVPSDPSQFDAGVKESLENGLHGISWYELHLESVDYREPDDLPNKYEELYWGEYGNYDPYGTPEIITVK